VPSDPPPPSNKAPSQPPPDVLIRESPCYDNNKKASWGLNNGFVMDLAATVKKPKQKFSLERGVSSSPETVSK